MIRRHWKDEMNVSEITDNEMERNLRKFGFQSIRIIAKNNKKHWLGEMHKMARKFKVYMRI